MIASRSRIEFFFLFWRIMSRIESKHEYSTILANNAELGTKTHPKKVKTPFATFRVEKCLLYLGNFILNCYYPILMLFNKYKQSYVTKGQRERVHTQLFTHPL